MSALKSEELYPGIRFHAVSDERFKTNQIEIHLVQPFGQDSAAKNALIPSLLRKGMRNTKTLQSLTTISIPSMAHRRIRRGKIRG